ncbi:MAG: dephospho-CoA kinase [Dissulfurispiraceae bacterium]
MIVVGLTGNYGMGKSTVARMFRELGAMTIDTDEIVAGLLSDTQVIDAIGKTFGDDIVKNNRVNKKMLADVVFGCPSLRISLEDILHPRVFEKIEGVVLHISRTKGPSMVIIEASVIFERGYQNRFDQIIAVSAPINVVISRLREKGISEEDVRKRLQSQFSMEMKADKTDFIVDNSKDMENTRRQVEAIYQQLLAKERRHENN